MPKLLSFFYDMVIWMELLSFVLGLVKFRQLKDTYWKWFICYLGLIFTLEAISMWGLANHPEIRKYYYDFFVIPLEFLFLFWLYARQSLGRKNLFLTSVTVYLLSFLPHFFYLDQTRMINAMSYTVGVLLLAIMAVLEFGKQVQSDAILQFRENKMFYINIGVVLFYVGTLPFFSFDEYLYKHEIKIWGYYFLFFLISVNLMYLLFAASFLWGKPKP